MLTAPQIICSLVDRLVRLVYCLQRFRILLAQLLSDFRTALMVAHFLDPHYNLPNAPRAAALGINRFCDWSNCLCGFYGRLYGSCLLTILTVGLERLFDVYRPTPITKPPLHQTGDR